MKPLDQSWPISQAIGMATILEASAPKLGNVHPSASFDDMHFGHFVASAYAVATVFEDVDRLTVGQLVLASVQATRHRVSCNTNLGTILLLAPLAKAAATLVRSKSEQPSNRIEQQSGLSRIGLKAAVAEVLQALTPDDSQYVYDAIRTAQPGGLGKQSDNDVTQPAPASLLSAMQQVADVDAVARQYVNNFADLFERFLPWLDNALTQVACPFKAIVLLQLRIMAWQPDGLIARKCGSEVARQVQLQSQHILQVVESDAASAQQQLEQFDRYLRTDGNRLNPGTTADLIAATLFCRLVSHRV
jgi:triphosphoribosyl-dephospho-CoA synthase